MIRKAILNDLKTVKSITDSCGKAMAADGIYQWNERYPSIEVFQQDIENEQLYVLEFEGKVIGCIMFSDFKDEVYAKIEWQIPDNKNLYIHRLAVAPEFQKQGCGQQLMDFAEDYAYKNRYLSIRLDTFSQNKRNQRFYEARDFKRLGDVLFPDQSKYPFHCYEKILVP